MELFERVRHIATSLARSETKLAGELGLTQQKLNGYFNPKSQRNLWEHLPKILELYPSVNRHWLYLDEGSMLAEGQPAEVTPNVSALLQRVSDLEQVIERQDRHIAACEKTIAALEETLDLYREKGVTPAGVPVPGMTSAAPSSPKSSEHLLKE